MPYIGNPIYQSAFVTDQFNGDGSTVAFTMSVAPAGVSNVLVAVSGVLQDPSTYGVAGNTITFSTAPPSGTGNISCRYLGVPVTGIVTTAYRTVTEFTATASQTTFTPPSYTVGFINVYLNGVLLGSADYTATNGTTVVLATGASAGNLVTVESFRVETVLNALSNSAGSVSASNLAGGAALSNIGTGGITDTYLASGSVTQAKLGTNVAGNGPAFSAYKSSGAGTQSITSGVFTKVTFDTELFDTNNNFASSTFTPTVAGYYQINSAVDCGSSAITRAIISIYKNGTNYQYSGAYTMASTTEFGPSIASVVYCNGSTDYLDIYVRIDGGTTLIYNGQIYTWFSGALVRSA